MHHQRRTCLALWPEGRRRAGRLPVGQDRSLPAKDTDRYGRVVAECFVQGQSVNRWMVSSGWAVAYRQYATAFVADESMAQQQKRNIWSGSFQVPSDFRRAKRASSVKASASEPPLVTPGCKVKGNISSKGKKIFTCLDNVITNAPP